MYKVLQINMKKLIKRTYRISEAHDKAVKKYSKKRKISESAYLRDVIDFQSSLNLGKLSTGK